MPGPAQPVTNCCVSSCGRYADTCSRSIGLMSGPVQVDQPVERHLEGLAAGLRRRRGVYDAVRLGVVPEERVLRRRRVGRVRGLRGQLGSRGVGLIAAERGDGRPGDREQLQRRRGRGRPHVLERDVFHVIDGDVRVRHGVKRQVRVGQPLQQDGRRRRLRRLAQGRYSNGVCHVGGLVGGRDRRRAGLRLLSACLRHRPQDVEADGAIGVGRTLLVKLARRRYHLLRQCGRAAVAEVVDRLVNLAVAWRRGRRWSASCRRYSGICRMLLFFWVSST